MYTAIVGKHLVSLVAAQEGKEYTAKSFFDEVYFPLFFANDRFLQNVNNSPVDQAYKQKEKKPLTQDVLEKCRLEVHRKAENQIADGSFFLGGAAADATATTSGQVTNMLAFASSEDVYASWIGAALGVGVQGRLSLLIDADAVLSALFEGWKHYRRFLEQRPGVKPMQINTWNGLWLSYRFGRNYAPNIAPYAAIDPHVADGALKPRSWIQVVFALAHGYRMEPERELLSYVYSFGQMNTTVGFVRLNLPQVRRPVELYPALFEHPSPTEMHPDLTVNSFVELYETDFSFREVCTQAEIGLRALRPRGLRRFVDTAQLPKATSQSDTRQELTFRTYKTWIIAMLNNKELHKTATDIATALHEISGAGQRAKTTHRQITDRVLQAKSRNEFIAALTSLLDDPVNSSEHAELLRHVVAQSLSLPLSNFPLFLTLIRFEHAYLAHTTFAPTHDTPAA